ncbi:MAG: hypothetical protein U9M95_02035 [Candidatus Altiarchaeota archaeon]|nr:hypothetical protein [Candidatus Altiarchaeota archaeon]
MPKKITSAHMPALGMDSFMGVVFFFMSLSESNNYVVTSSFY